MEKFTVPSKLFNQVVASKMAVSKRLFKLSINKKSTAYFSGEKISSKYPARQGPRVGCQCSIYWVYVLRSQYSVDSVPLDSPLASSYTRLASVLAGCRLLIGGKSISCWDFRLVTSRAINSPYIEYVHNHYILLFKKWVII